MLLLTKKEWARIQANFAVDELGSCKSYSSTVLTEIPPPRCVMKVPRVPAGGIEIVKTMAHN